MAKLVTCRVCDREVSSDAGSCPHCGAARPSKSHNARVWILVIALLIALQVAGYFSG